MRGSKVRVLRILVDRVNPTITDGDTAQIDPWISLLLYAAGNVWNIVARIAFSRQVDLAPLKLWVLCHEVVEEIIEILCDSIFSPAKRSELIDKAEASAEWLVDVHDICNVVPTLLIALESERLLGVPLAVLVPVWTILCVEAEH